VLDFILGLVGVVFLLFVAMIAGVVLAYCELYFNSPDLYEEWKRRREERKVDK